MALADLLSTKKDTINIDVTEDILRRDLDRYRELIAYWRVYPDRFVDYLCSLDPNNTFHFYFYQRLTLRIIFRHKYSYAVFCRAYSKSFLSILSLMLKAILYPGAHLFTVAAGKEQSASIVNDKISELCRLIPALGKEIIWDTRGIANARTRQTKDSVIYTFKSGSVLENVACSDKTRGRRFTAGLLEEAATLNQDLLQQVIIPTLNVSRRLPNGQVDPDEVINQSQTFVTSAGYKNTYAYDRLIQMLCQMVARPQEAFIFGGDWRIPVKEGLIPGSFVADLKMEGTFNEATFDREYNSNWGGDIESAFFSYEVFDRNRVLHLPEYKPNNRNSAKAYYILGVDVGRFNCTTEICVFKVSPAPSGAPLKQLVNIYTIDAEHFGIQAIKIKQIFNQYKCKVAVVDGNGLGSGLVDFLVTDQIDVETGETLYNWGVRYKDDDERQKYRKFETPDTIHNAMYIMKANAPLNTEMYSYCQTQLQHGKIKFLIDDSIAKNKLMAQAQGKKMTPEKRAEYLMPFVQTNILREQMANLIEESEGANIILKPANRKIKHDKFSALIYGLYFCKLEEDKGKKRTGRNISDFMMFSKPLGR